MSEQKTWPEVKRAFDEKRYELVLVGPEFAKRIEDNQNSLDENLFNLKHLNFLEVAKTRLSTLPPKLGLMENLTSLLCHSNELTSLPDEIGMLVNMKNLNLSNNKLTVLPQSLSNMKELFTINFSGLILIYFSL
jgi:Leucine-rich repeat (LRR) protein